MPSDKISYRSAASEDIEAMKSLVFEHGPNEWNYLPPEKVTAHLDGIGTGESQGCVAYLQNRLIGLVTFEICNSFARYEPAMHQGQLHGCIVEGVVDRQFAGQGVGSRLAQMCKQALRAAGITRIYVERHAENLASAGAMRKAGFVEVETFYDPERRTSGSRETTVSRFTFDAAE